MSFLAALAARPIDESYVFQPGEAEYIRTHHRLVRLGEGPHFQILNDYFRVLPHNSGGAIDLTVIGKDGQPWDFGTPIDEPTQAVRENRRILFHLMVEAGFVSHRPEWWHFELGTKRWGQGFGHPPIYDSMEPQVKALGQEGWTALPLYC